MAIATVIAMVIIVTVTAMGIVMATVTVASMAIIAATMATTKVTGITMKMMNNLLEISFYVIP